MAIVVPLFVAVLLTKLGTLSLKFQRGADNAAGPRTSRTIPVKQ